MSTKTTIKRIALVAVAALGLGTVSTVSANAGQGIAGGSVTLASTTTTASVGVATTVSATLSGYCLGVANAQTQDNRGAFAIYLNSVPTNGSGVIQGLSLTKVSVTGNATDNQDNAAAIAYDCTQAGFFSGTATASVVLPSAGTYTFKIEGVYQVGGSATWTVVAAPKGEITAAASTLSATTISGDKTALAQAGQVVVAANNAAGNADAAVLSATVSGPGLVSWANAAAAGRAVSQAANNAGTLTFYGDGTAGTGTVSIYSGTTLLGTVSTSFYGAVTKLVATQSKYALSDAAGASAFAVITAFDANNVAVPLAAADGTASAANGTFSDGAGVTAGTVNLLLDPAVATFGSKSTVWTHTATGVTVNASVLVSSIVANTVTIATPADSLVPGQKYTVSVTIKDANGYAIPDDAARAITISTSRASSVAVPTTASFVNGVASVDLYAPVTPGDFTLTMTDNVTTTATKSETIALGNPSQDSLDAANEATDAANAATDAANAAAEAADAATAAAQDAQAAVAELATKVASLIAGIKAQITTLTNLVIKIQKKVKA